MDTTDPNLIFGNSDICDYCNNYYLNIKPYWNWYASDNISLIKMSEKIRSDGKNKEHDCIIGISGGLDSSYAAYVAKSKMSLRPLLYHVDTGWNTHQSVNNIKKIVDGLGVDLVTDVVNWEEMKDLQVAFFKSGIPDQDLPQDAVIFSSLYKFARKNNFKHIITGSNFSNECCREPEEWGGYLGVDVKLIRDIYQQFSKSTISSLPLLDIFLYKIYYQFILGTTIHKPLNFLPFELKEAEEELKLNFGWEPFKHKHHESRFTRFFEDFWLPRRFGFDKRKAHLSSLILTNQIRREEALMRVSKPEMSEEFLQQEFEYVAKKLGLSTEQFREIFDLPKKTFKNYKNKRTIILFGAHLLRMFGIEKRYFR
jgi:N-acetyl sugar amidotransferase